MLTISFDVAGDESVSGSVVHGPLSFDLGATLLSCRGFADGGRTADDLGEGLGGIRYFAFPWLDDSDGVGGRFVSVTIGVFRYEGPGTYTEKHELQTNPSEVGLVIEDSEFTLPHGGSTSVVIDADGSGSWSFPRLESQDGGVIGGSMSWTCEDRP